MIKKLDNNSKWNNYNKIILMIINIFPNSNENNTADTSEQLII